MPNTKVKIFQATGKGEIDDLESRVNSWLSENIGTIAEVKGMETAMAQVARDALASKRMQTYVLTVWYVVL